MGLSVPFVFRDCKGIGRVMMEKQAWLSQNISVFHQKVNVRDYLSVLTISLSNLVNCISLLRPVVKSSYVPRMLLLKIKFFQRNVAVPGMKALCYRPIRTYLQRFGGREAQARRE